jgi:hypothetical protein
MDAQVASAQLIAACLPAVSIIVTIIIGIMSNNRAIDGVHRRLDNLRADFKDGFDRADRRFDQVEQRLGRLEDRMEHPVVRSS